MLELYNENDITIIFFGIFEHSKNSWLVDLSIENNSNEDIRVVLYPLRINGYVITLGNDYEKVPKHSKLLSKTNFEYVIDLKELTDNGILSIKTVEFNLDISKAREFSEKICKEKYIKIETNKTLPTIEKSKKLTIGKTKKLLFNDENIKIIFNGILEYSKSSWVVDLYIENNNDEDIKVILYDMRINRFVIGLSNNFETIPKQSIYLSKTNYSYIIGKKKLQSCDINKFDTLDFDLTIKKRHDFFNDLARIPIHISFDEQESLEFDDILIENKEDKKQTFDYDESRFDSYTETVLHQLGYRVGASGLSETSRRRLLDKIIEKKQLTPYQISRTIQNNISLFRGRGRFKRALEDWKNDLNYIKSKY